MSDPLDPARGVIWQNNVGVAGGIPDTANWPIHATILPSGVDDTTAIRNALSSCPSGKVVQLGSGTSTDTFKISSEIGMQYTGPNKVLRGKSPTKTIINVTGGQYTFHVRGGYYPHNDKQVLLSVNAVKGQSTVTVASVPSWVTVGNIYFISQLDDPTYVSHESVESNFEHSSWYYAGFPGGNGGGEERCMGQLNKLVSKTATTMTFELPLYWSYGTALSAAVNEGPYDPNQNRPVGIGFENFSIVSQFSHLDYDMFHLENCESCWFKNVNITNMTGRSGIRADFGYRLQVQHCTIKDSHQYGAGHGYGVALYNMCSGCLVQDCIFDHLHIGLDLSYTAAGCVGAYNLFLVGYADSVGADPSIATHAVHNFMNLFEGNYCREYIGFDIVHGSSSHHTLMRNRVINDGNGAQANSSALYFQQYNRYANVIGNILGRAGFHTGYDKSDGGAQVICDSSVKTIYEIGCGCDNDGLCNGGNDTIATSQIQRSINYDTVTAGIRFDGFVIGDLPNSYYLASAPSWFGNLTWPPYSPTDPSGATMVKIPAGYRYVNGVDPASVLADVPFGGTIVFGGTIYPVSISIQTSETYTLEFRTTHDMLDTFFGGANAEAVYELLLEQADPDSVGLVDNALRIDLTDENRMLYFGGANAEAIADYVQRNI